MREKIHPRNHSVFTIIKRHPAITTIIAMPILAVVLFIGTAIAMGLVQAVHISDAHTPQELAEAATWYGHDIEIDRSMNSSVVLRETLGTGFFNTNYHNEIKADCFDLQRAFWRHYPGMQSLDIELYIPRSTHDGLLTYAGNCVMQQTTAAKQDWGKLNDDSAWELYDEKSVNPDIAS